MPDGFGPFVLDLFSPSSSNNLSPAHLWSHEKRSREDRKQEPSRASSAKCHFRKWFWKCNNNALTPHPWLTEKELKITAEPDEERDLVRVSIIFCCLVFLFYVVGLFALFYSFKVLNLFIRINHLRSILFSRGVPKYSTITT